MTYQQNIQKLKSIMLKVAESENLPLKEVNFVKKLDGKVGYCTSDGRITIKLNSSRIMEPEIKLQENARTAAHELAHLKHFHHSEPFWKYSEKLCELLSIHLGVKILPETYYI